MQDLFIPNTGLGLKRDELPQIPSNSKDFFLFLKEKCGVLTQKQKICANELAPSQDEFNIEKVKSIIDTKSINGDPIIVSNDNYVLDGHHRWLAAINVLPSTELDCIVCDCDIFNLYHFAKDYNKVQFKSVDEFKVLRINEWSK